MPWIACLAVPLFPLAARLRSEPELLAEAAAVCAGNGNAARIVAATRRARRAGIEPGQTLPQARALLPQLVTRARDAECERAAQEALLEAAGELSPRVEDGGEGTVYADVDGLERHFRPAPGEAEPGGWPAALGRALAAAAERAGLPARVGVAASKLAARVAAGLPESPTVVAAGEEADFLAPLPLDRLAPELSLAATLDRWGVRSIGDLARLPAAEVASRLGPVGADLHAVARGRDPRPLVPYQPPPTFREGLALEWPLVDLEPFLFVGRAALERLTRRMEARGLACSRIELSMRLEPDGVDERAIVLPAPTREVKTLLTLLRLELEARPPGAPLAAFSLVGHPDRPREAQLSLFGPAALSPDRLATTLARLFALLGPDRVGSPRRVDGHRPERFALAPFAPPPPPSEPPEPPARKNGGRGLLAVRVLRPPVPLEVIVAEAAGTSFSAGAGPTATANGNGHAARPVSLAPAPGAEAPNRLKLRGRVRVASGPWGLEDEWWSEAPAERDYWDVELTAGPLVRIYRERGSGEWYADGVYD
jgi:protein ImuB